MDNGVEPTSGNPLIDGGAFSQIRILGIGANQTTGQTRVPVIITSIYDDSVGTTVNNVQMNTAITGNKQLPAAGDGGVIYFGGNMLTDYNLLDPRDGSVIDNADIKYITRIEQQGGGIIYTVAANNGGVFGTGNFYNEKVGLPQTVNGVTNNVTDQYNQAKSLTISNSNLSTFSDAGFIAHPGYDAIGVATNFNNAGGQRLRDHQHQGRGDALLPCQRHHLEHADRGGDHLRELRQPLPSQPGGGGVPQRHLL